MRGIRAEFTPAEGIYGIIPAYAGNTDPAFLCALNHADHPRLCGEHQYRGDEQKEGRGSSPLMRGTRQEIWGSIGNFRIIPAYAGNTM